MADGASVHAFAADAQGRDLRGAVHARVTDGFARYRYGAAADQALHAHHRRVHVPDFQCVR